MAEIEITLPTVQYGNVKVRATPEELGVDISSPAAVGTATAIYLNLFTQGFKLGASMDVTASPTEGLSAPVSASQSEVDQVIDETLKNAQKLVEDGLGATEVDDSMSLEEGMRLAAEAGVRDANKAPWDRPAVDTPKRPWETDGVPAPKPVVDEGW